jgi:hypothetical protein
MVWDFHDGARSGLSDFGGKPHYFKCVFANGDYTDSFELKPIDSTLLQVAKEQWVIYRTWERKFHAGEVPLETHPGHGGIVPRYDELDRSIKACLESLPGAPLVARGVFRAVDPQPEIPFGCLRETEVHWTLVG